MIYCALEHIVTGHQSGSVLYVTWRWTRFTGSWTIIYRTLDHTVMDYQPCCTELWTCSTVAWSRIYYALGCIMLGYWPCGTEPCTQTTGGGPWFAEHIIQGHWPCGRGHCTMCYRVVDVFYSTMDTFSHAVDHELLCHGSYCTRTLTLWYWAL